MKTKIQIIAIALAGLIIGGCSSSLQLSKSPGQNADDVYYTPDQKTASGSEQLADNSTLKRSSNSDINLDELEKKYADILSNDTTGKIDTVVYKAEEIDNPYERILSDSYQESYERRLRARYSGWYGIGGIYNYDDYWYASSYDPAFYNVIVMGSEIWVEPWYISSMFGWPGYRYYGYGYSSPYWGWGYNPYRYNYWGWNSYAWGYNSGFWNGYYWGNYYGDNYYNNNNNNNYYHGSYGSRPNNNGAVVAGSRPNATGATAGLNDRQRDLADRQVVLTNQDPVPASQRPLREGTATQNDIRKPNVVTRPSRESLNINPTRVVTDNREYTRAEPTRESYNPSYTKPKPASTNEFNRPTRNYPAAETVKGSGEGTRQPVAAPQRVRTTQPERTYSPPPRTSTPSSSPNRDSGTRSNSGSRVSPSSSGSSSSGSSSSRSSGGSSGSSSSSSSRGSSSSSSSSSNNTGRVR